MRDLLFMLGRLLYCAVFVGSGLGHLTQTEASAQYAGYKKVPNAKLMVQISGACMILGAVAVVLGVFMDLAAFLLAVLVVVMAFFMHRFWEETDPQAVNVERAAFMKNLSIAGAGLIIAAWASQIDSWTLGDPLFKFQP